MHLQNPDLPLWLRLNKDPFRTAKATAQKAKARAKKVNTKATAGTRKSNRQKAFRPFSYKAIGRARAKDVCFLSKESSKEQAKEEARRLPFFEHWLIDFDHCQI